MADATGGEDIVGRLERSAMVWGSVGGSIVKDIRVSRSLCRAAADECEAACHVGLLWTLRALQRSALCWLDRRRDRRIAEIEAEIERRREAGERGD